jgi:hypothetical protein
MRRHLDDEGGKSNAVAGCGGRKTALRRANLLQREDCLSSCPRLGKATRFIMKSFET